MKLTTRIALLALCLATPAAAQDSARVDLRGLGFGPGSRVRVVAPPAVPDPLVGRVSVLTADTLLLARGHDRIAVDPRTVRRLEVSAGKHRFWWGLGGAAVGMIVGGALGGHAGANEDSDTGLGAAAGFFAGAIVGIPVGAIAGALAAPERWVPVHLPHGGG
jgi:hypothetical protein